MSLAYCTAEILTLLTLQRLYSYFIVRDKFALKIYIFFKECLMCLRLCLFPSKSKVNLEIYKRM